MPIERELPLTVYEYLRKRTDVQQLCVILDSGWIVETAWIDYEDLFRISNQSADMIVIGAQTGELPISDNKGGTVKVPCLYIDAKHQPKGEMLG